MIADVFISAISFLFIGTMLIFWNIYKYHRTISKKKNKKKKEIRFVEISYLNYKYGICVNRLMNIKFMIIISILDALIICGTYLIISLIPLATAWQLLIAFVVVFGLIYSVYGITGTILVKRGYQNEYKRNRK